MAVQAKKQKFKANDYVVYPAHGVGKVLVIEEEEIAGMKLELYVVDFEKEKMRLRVPTAKAVGVGMRKLSSKADIENCLQIGRAHV